MAIRRNAAVAGPAVGLEQTASGSAPVSTKRPRSAAAVGGDFGQPQVGPGWFHEFDAAPQTDLASCRLAAPLPAAHIGWRSFLVRKRKAGLVDFDQAELHNRLRSGLTIAVRSLWASSQALRYEPMPSCFWSCRAEMPLEWVDHQVGGLRTRSVSGSLLACRIIPRCRGGLPAAAGAPKV